MATTNPDLSPSSRWTFLSNHAHVLICLRRNPNQRLREIAEKVGITERMVQRIVSDLEAASILIRHREGRTNRYSINLDRPLRHPLESHRSVEDLLQLVGAEVEETDTAT